MRLKIIFSTIVFTLVLSFFHVTSAHAQQKFYKLFQLKDTNQFIFVIFDEENKDSTHPGNLDGFRLYKGPITSMKEIVVTEGNLNNHQGADLKLANGDHFDYSQPYDEHFFYTSSSGQKEEMVLLSEEVATTTEKQMKIEHQELEFELRLTGVGGMVELPIDVEWGFKFINKKNNGDHIGFDCTIQHNDSVSIIKTCGVFHFSTSVSGTGMVIFQSEPVIAQQPKVMVKTHGWGISKISDNSFRDCYRSLRLEKVGTMCKEFTVSDEGVKYKFTVKKISELLAN